MGNTRKIVFGGITTGLVIVSLYSGSLFVNNRLFFLAAATYITSIPYIVGGRLYGFIAYAASSVLIIFLIPNKLYALVYIILGIYPLVKLICEGYNLIKEFSIKYLWFNSTLGAMYFALKDFIIVNREILGKPGIVILIFGAQIVFFVYDYLFTRFIVYVDKRVLKKL